ncbi:MAG: translesion error-prone DNA polymerase V autoproteolytic subunit [Desulfobulbaceae bacterium]|jgi:DNA polymerase V|nr:translesion error-prone DNA polymerase V autoproteolytic subunit [Desulfobulbaceae bacterium]MDY0351962.1 translesion error-prone DNA polymerase V autoproteolytic subunit [Desulfobulbaceae bacterium]
MTMRTDSTIAAVYGLERKSRLSRPLFLSGVSAGFPSPAEDYVDRTLDLNELLIKNPAATFFVRVAGDSMTGAGIHHDDILVVDRSLEPVSNNIVIAVYDGELTVKRLVRDKNGLRLVAENPNYPPLEITEENGCEIWGVVTSVVHQL